MRKTIPDINKQSQDLYGVVGVEDVANENATAFSGGTVVLFDRPNYRGSSIVLQTGQFRSLGRFNNRALSVAIAPQVTWRFWTEQGFTGARLTLSGGQRGQFLNLDGLSRNNLESARRLP